MSKESGAQDKDKVEGQEDIEKGIENPETPTESDSGNDDVNQQLLEEIKTLRSEIDSLKQREIKKNYENIREEKLNKLRELDPNVAEKYSSESSLDKLDMAIEVVSTHQSSIDERFPEFQQVKKDKKSNDGQISYRDPITGDFV